MNSPTPEFSPPITFDTIQVPTIPDRTPSLVLTGYRLNRRHVVFVLGVPVRLTSRAFDELLELVRSRLTTRTGFRPVPPSQIEVQDIRLQIHRLRRAIDDHTAPGTGDAIIQTGSGTEYRLAVSPAEIAVDVSFYELPSPMVATDIVVLLRELAHHVQLECNHSEIPNIAS